MSLLVSVIVPIYKSEKYLPQCLESIVSQTYKNLEIILVDDGSPDNCPKICDEWAKKDSRIKVIHQKNGGLSNARNNGISVAGGELIALVDSDDYIALDMVEKSIKAFNLEDIDIVVYDVARVNESGDFIETTEDIKEEILTRDDALNYLFDSTIHDYAVNKLYKKKLFNDVKYPEGEYYEDISTTYKLFFNAKKVYCLPESLYYYRRNNSGVVGKMTDATLRDLFFVRKRRYDELVQNYPQYAKKCFKLTACAALNYYDRCLWSNCDKLICDEAVNFLNDNKEKVIGLHNNALTLFVKTPKFYKCYRILKHKIGNVVKKIKR